jgi:hypothetical protein
MGSEVRNVLERASLELGKLGGRVVGFSLRLERARMLQCECASSFSGN